VSTVPDLRCGDSFEILKTLSADSVDACVTDPPYELTGGKKGASGDASLNLNSPAGRSRATTGFMNKKWDGTGIAHSPLFWGEVLRVMKPGAYLVAFAGTRTYHRMTCAIEDAGFEIRDQLAWVFGSGFPKSMNMGAGRGTALKPAWEPIVLARKPLGGTVESNLAAHGTGTLNIDDCRIPFAGAADEAEAKAKNQHGEFESGARTNDIFVADDRARTDYEATGRFPANLCHDGSEEVLHHFPISDVICGFPAVRNTGFWADKPKTEGEERRMDGGSAARFFFCAKTSTAEREAGLEHLPDKIFGMSGAAAAAAARGEHYDNGDGGVNQTKIRKNTHPTVKPVALMRWLVRLVTPKGGTCIDPFMGSGTTGVAAVCEDRAFIGSEKEAEYFAIAKARIDHARGELFI